MEREIIKQGTQYIKLIDMFNNIVYVNVNSIKKFSFYEGDLYVTYPDDKVDRFECKDVHGFLNTLNYRLTQNIGIIE